MPDPTTAAYRLFSWMRQGLLAGITNATGTGNPSAHGHLVLPVRLRISDTHDVSPKSTVADAVARDVFIVGIIGVRPLIREGWGLIELDRTLYFEGDVRKLAVWDVRHTVGLTPLVDIRRHELVVLDGAEQLKVTLVWTEPGPTPPTLSSQLVNDLDLLVTAPDGTEVFGNNIFLVLAGFSLHTFL